MNFMRARTFASERDFVARFLYPCLQEASSELGISESMDIFVEKRINGIPDIVVEKDGKSLFIIEAKFKRKIGSIERDIEPRDPFVVGQAIQYANFGGFPFYATCNVNRLVLFQLRPGIKAFESIIESYEYDKVSDWAKSVLEITLGLVPIKLKPLDDSLVDTIHEAFKDLYPEFFKSLKQRLREKRFNESYIEWLESQGLELSEETNRIIASQATYLELNKFLFYKLISHIYPERLKKLKIEEHEDVAESLSNFYDDVLEIDYAPIYEKGILNEISLTKRAEVRIRTLLDTLDEFDFSKMESDFTGRIYERIIPPDERKRLGQFYTPPSIVDLITRLTIKNADDIILDPGCGSGSFLVKAYHRLRDLKGFPRESRGLLAYSYHQEIINQIYGIDINQFPAHLSVINLAIQNIRARINNVNVLVKDFFNIKTGVSTLAGFKGFNIEGEQTSVKLPPFFDVILANPPYIRQETLGPSEKILIKKLIEQEYRNKLFIGSTPKKPKRAISLNKQSDIYIYFFIHGIKFLRNNGMLGFISSNKWLEVDYGPPFQKFLLANTRILYIIEFDRAVFPDADVNTVITILEKEKDKEKRDNTEIKFIRFKGRMDNQIEIIQKNNRSFEDEKIRVNIILQKNIEEGKWSIFLRAPPVFQSIKENSKIKPLESIAKVFRGPTTGYKKFFVLDENVVKKWKIESRFVTLFVSSPKDVKGLVVEENDITNNLFMVDKAIKDLQGTNVLDYIKYGSIIEVKPRKGSNRGPRKIPELETMKSRKLWYSLPNFQIAPIILVKMMDKRPKAIWNKAGSHASNLFYYIIPEEKEYELVLLGYLNSSLAAFLVELYGRSYGGGVLELAAYELKTLPVIDPDSLSTSEKINIEEKFKEHINSVEVRIMAEEQLKKFKSKDKGEIGQKGLFETDAEKKLDESKKMEEKTLNQLDEAIYDALDLKDDERLQIEKGLKELQEIRRLRTKT